MSQFAFLLASAASPFGEIARTPMGLIEKRKVRGER